MIRSTRIPPILNRICDDVVHSALLVTADGELLGASTKRSAASLFPPTAVTSTTDNNNNNNNNTIDMMDNLGTLIADIAVDYQRLGEEYVGIENNHNNNNNKNGGTSSSQQQQQQQQQQQNQLSRGSSGSGGNNTTASGSSNITNTNNNTNTNIGKSSSQLQCLLVELELGLVAVSSCGSFDCLVIAIAAPNAPLGVLKAKIQTLAVYVQEALSPLAENT